MSKSKLLILERSLSEITLNESSRNSGDYVLEGIFSEIGVKNKNNRIYDESEFVPHIEELSKLVESKKVLGELDHPKQFEVSLKNVSHVIETIYYDKSTKQVKGKIRLLDTDAGKQAKALVDGGVPIHISSRAAGVVEGNGHVKIKKLFTYDLVADPGFENAQLNRINESFGLEDDSNIQIYSIEDENISEETKETKTIMETENKKSTSYISVEDFNEYTQIIKGEFNNLKESLEGVKTGLSESTNDIKADGDLVKYVEEIANTVNDLTESVTDTVENVDNLISHNDYIVEGLEGVKNYAEEIAIKTDQGIEYSKSLAENLDQSIEYTKHIAENLDDSISYSENTNEELDKLIEYTKDVSETVDRRMQYQDTINEELDNVIGHNDYIIENMNGISKYQNYLKENVENLGNYTESIVNDINEENGFDTKELKSTEEYQKLTESKELPELKTDDSWKNNILESIKSLTESAKKQKAVEESKELNFLNFLSESKRSEFETLEESKKEDVILAFNENKYFGSKDAERIYESVFNESPKTDLWLNNMPAKYADQWQNLSESRKNEIKAQASISNFDNQYSIDHFWSTRDLRDDAVSLNEEKSIATEEKTVVNESSKYETPDAYMEAVRAGLAQRFGK